MAGDGAIARARRDLLAIYVAAVDAVRGRVCVRRELERDAPGDGPVWLVAIGKAAQSMALGALDVLGGRIARGLVITKRGHLDGTAFSGLEFESIEGGHPVPDERSLAAGEALLAFVAKAPPQARLLILISGGCSSLVEVLPEGVSLDALQRVNAWLLASGWDIVRMNAVRKALSRIKGGRLTRLLRGRAARVLLISDVPEDDPGVIGSGLLAPDRGARVDIAALDPPGWLRELLGRGEAPPAADDPLFDTIESRIIASLGEAREAAEARARALGYGVRRHDEFISGEAAAVGEGLAMMLQAGAGCVHIWGGETTVHLPPDPGSGGRNQHLALAAAIRLEGCDDCVFLSAGSDGSDGPTEDAGALVDGGTVQRESVEGLDPQACLAAADSGRFLAASGDLVHTGPTGTNVMDLMLGLKFSPGEA